MAEERFSPCLRQCFVTALVCFNIVSYGNLLGFPAVLLPQLHAPESNIPMTKERDSWITSSVAFSILVGNFLTPSIMDRLGRRAAQFCVCVPAIAGWLIIVLAGDFLTLITGRIVQGFGFGMMLPLRSALIGEYTSPKKRGAFLSTVSLSQGFGIFLVHLLGSLLPWQTTAFICAFFPFLSLIMTLYAPESPSFLAARGRYEECRESFRWLRGLEEENELKEMIEAREAFNKEERKPFSLNELLKIIRKKEFYKPITIMIHANAMMQYSGGNTMAAYSTTIIGLILGSGASVHFWMVFLDAQRIVSNVLAVFIMNRFKRKTLLVCIGGVCVAVHLALAFYVYMRNNGFIHGAIWIPILLINVQFFTIATGMVPLPTVIAGEVFPLQYRSIGGSVGVVATSLFSFLVLKTFPGMIDGIGIEGTYVVFAGILTYILFVIWTLLPETKGKTLQQIEAEFKGIPLKPVEIEQMKSLTSLKSRKLSTYSHLSLTGEV